MRCLDRNKQAFWYCLYDGTTAATDSSGYKTGEPKTVYKSAVKTYGNISAGSTSITYGTMEIDPFGVSVKYDRVIVLEDMDCPIDKNTVLFVEHEPTYAEDGTPLFDYAVKKVAKSLGSGVSIAILKVR